MSGNYSLLVPLMMFGWIPIGLLLVSRLGMVRGIVSIFVLGWLLLPVASYKAEGIPEYTKISAVCTSAIVAIAVFDSRRFATLRFRAVDLAVLGWCLTPAISSLVNDLGPYDAVAGIVEKVLTWGVPYVVGKLYFRDETSIRALAVGVVFGGMLYVPLCLYEIVMSPQLHTMFYGFYPHQFLQSKRFGGWRPSVFLQHGLAVGLFMSTATLAAVCLWRKQIVPKLLGIRMGHIAVTLLVVTVMCKSIGALVVLLSALLVLALSNMTRTRGLVLALVLFAPVYVSLRGSGTWQGVEVMEFADSMDADRGDSLRTRMQAENKIVKHTLNWSPWFGWGGFGRNMVDRNGNHVAVMDGYWIIVFSKWGTSGLATFLAAGLLPGIVFVLRVPRGRLCEREFAPATVLTVIVCMFMIDCLFNAMANPMYILSTGALAMFGGQSLAAAAAPRRRVLAPRPLSGPSGGAR